MQDEFEMNMRLLGARNLKEVVPEMVDTTSLAMHHGGVPDDRLYNVNCEPGFRAFFWTDDKTDVTRLDSQTRR